MSCLRRLGLALLAAGALLAAPKIARVYPLGGQQGATVAVEILGEQLSNTTTVEFDCPDLRWTRTTQSSTAKVSGEVAIAPGAALGPHILRVATLDGYSTSAIFNVGQFPSVLEAEPNDRQPQRIGALPVEIQGRLDGSADIDTFAIEVRAGERWTFDLRSIEYGSSLEAKMFLLDEAGRQVAFNDDRDDYDETPFIEHTFERGGVYVVKLDQYRGPRGFNFGKNSGYILRISSLPRIEFIAPLGAGLGTTARVRLAGSALEAIERVWLTEARRAEYFRLTYPYTMPVHFRPDPGAPARIDGKVIGRAAGQLEAEFVIPYGARPGLWRLWGAGPRGVTEGSTFEISAGRAIDGELSRTGQENIHDVRGVAGQTLHFWTLAAQLGGPHLDTVIEVRDAAGRKLAENDDVVAGQGSLLGNPDSSVYYTPPTGGPLQVAVKDRLGRGGPSYQYRLKIASERPGFQLVTTPENFAVPRGGEGEIKVHLIREAGHQGEIEVRVEGFQAARGRFRADQLFEPNADGADMIMPELAFRLKALESLAPGEYPLRIFGKDAEGRIVEAQTTLLIGPLLDLWNFIRRPSPRITMTVYEPFDARVSAASSLSLKRGQTATLELKVEKVPEEARWTVANVPEGISYRVAARGPEQVTLLLEASAAAAVGSYEISVEADVGKRRASSGLIALSVGDK